MKKYILGLLLLIPSIALAQKAPKTERENAAEQLRKFTQAYTLINALYIEPVDNNKLVEDAIKKLVSDLDPHSIYVSAEDMVSSNESMTGKFAGIGVTIMMLNDTLIITGTVPNGPAEKVGILPNDKIIAVDNENVVGMKLNDIVKRLRGPKKTPVMVDIARHANDKPLVFKVVRDDIPIVTVDAAYMIDKNTGYIKINRFATTTMKEMEEAFNKFDNPKALILDLRNNGGGLLGQSIDMANFFLPRGYTVLSTKGRSVKDMNYQTTNEGRFTVGKVVVLIDEFTASASEIVAGAIQDWDRGVIVGRRSFGKGLVQQQHTLLDGSAINITVSEYFTPSGRAIQRPFTKGDLDTYYKDLAEMINNDKLESNDSLRFKTLRLGKDVYGGGGIYPDYYVHTDTTDNSEYLNNLLRKGIIFEFTASYLDRHRKEIINTYPDKNSFRDLFSVNDEIISELTAFAQTRELELDQQALNKSVSYIKRRLKFLLAQNLYGLEDAIEISNPEDPTFLKGLEIINNWNRMAKDFATDKI